MPDKMKKQLTSNLHNAVKKFDLIDLVYLFGSFLRGEVYQDIDLGVVINDHIPSKEKWSYLQQVAREAEKAIKYAVPVDVRLLNEAPPKFCYQVLKTGRLLFVRSEAVRIRYEKEIMLTYLDFQEADRWFDTKLAEAISRL